MKQLWYYFPELSSLLHLSEVEWIWLIFPNSIKGVMNPFLNLLYRRPTNVTVSLKRFQR